MGRPINKKYFVKQGTTDPSVAVKFQGIRSLVVNHGQKYSQGTTAVVSPLDDISGQPATIALTFDPNSPGNDSTHNGKLYATISNVGAGYSSIPTIQIVKPPNVNHTVTDNSGNYITLDSVEGIYLGMSAEGSHLLSNSWVESIDPETKIVGLSRSPTQPDIVDDNITFRDKGQYASITCSLTHAELDTGTIATSAWINGDSQARPAAILKQEASHRYLVENANYLGVCKLTTSTSALTEGLMSIIAKDANGSSYIVTKLTSRKARVVQQTPVGSFVFDSGKEVRWAAGYSSASGTISTAPGARVGVQTY